MAGDGQVPLIVVDAANVVGSRPDGWWRDRFGATERLRDRLSTLAAAGTAGGPQWAQTPPVEVVMVVEGRARGVSSTQTVTVVDAEGSGDDTIAATVTATVPRLCLVVTSDRQLRQRVLAAGGAVAGVSILALTRSGAQGGATDAGGCSRFKYSQAVSPRHLRRSTAEVRGDRT